MIHGHYPASYPVGNMIAIAATTPANQYASFSNYGTNTVSIAAPGQNILSTIPRTLRPRLTVADSMIPAYRIHNTQQLPHEALTATLIDCGIGALTNFPNEVAGNIAFISAGHLPSKIKLTMPLLLVPLRSLFITMTRKAMIPSRIPVGLS